MNPSGETDTKSTYELYLKINWWIWISNQLIIVAACTYCGVVILGKPGTRGNWLLLSTTGCRLLGAMLFAIEAFMQPLQEPHSIPILDNLTS